MLIYMWFIWLRFVLLILWLRYVFRIFWWRKWHLLGLDYGCLGHWLHTTHESGWDMMGKIYPPEAASTKDVTKLKIWDVAVIESNLVTIHAKIIALECQIILTHRSRDILEKDIQRRTKTVLNYAPSSGHPQHVLILRVLCSTSGWFCSTSCHNKLLQHVIQPHEISHLSSSSLQLLASSPCPILHISIHNHL